MYLFRVTVDTKHGRVILVRCANDKTQATQDVLKDATITLDYGSVIKATAVYLCTVDELISGKVILQDNWIRRTK